MNQQFALQNALRSRFETARIRYPRYSVRAFAKKCGVSPATLSLILRGKRKISSKLMRALSDRLMFDPQERAAVFAAELNLKSKSKADLPVQLSTDQYRLISDWRAFALLNLTQTKGFKSDVKWIARRLGISREDVQDVLQSLKRLSMIEEKNGKLTRSAVKYQTSDDIANMSLRKSHFQTLELAQVSLENESVEQRDFSWITFPFDLRKMEKVKTLIRKFQDDIYDLVETDPERTEVYRLAVQLFPLTKLNHNGEENK